MAPPASTEVLEIEALECELQTREKDSTESFSLHPEMPVSADATIVLRIYTRITAIPSQLIEDVQLEILRQQLPPSHWESQSIGGPWERYLYFDIPHSITIGPHRAWLIVKGTGEVEKKSQPFDVYLTRAYRPRSR